MFQYDLCLEFHAKSVGRASYFKTGVVFILKTLIMSEHP